MDSIARYLEVFDDLRRRKGWSASDHILRFAALTLAATEINDPGTRLEATAKVLAKEAGMFSVLRSPIRHAVAAMVLRRGLDPARVVHRVKETLDKFKARKLKKGGSYPLLAALLLVFDAGGKPVPAAKIIRLKAILDLWKKDHRFLTGQDDYPMAAMHASRGVGVEQLCDEIERIYQALRKEKFSRGNPLQLVSHLLAFSDLAPNDAARRFTRMTAELKKNRQRVGVSEWDEVALLVLSGEAAGRVAAKVVRYRDRLREVKPRPPASLAFSIAAGMVLAEQAAGNARLKGSASAATLRNVQAMMDAQSAAMIACMSSVMVATTVATTH